MQEPGEAGSYRLGSHSVLVTDVFTHDGIAYVTILNSWGTLWGNDGCGHMRAEHIKEAWGIVDLPPILMRSEVDKLVVDTTANKMTYYIDGIGLSRDTSTVIKDGRIHLQLRDIIEAIGWEEIQWDNINKVATFYRHKQAM
jgi:hypothetical protein